MSLSAYVHVDEEFTADVDDDDIVAYVCEEPALLARILEECDIDAETWANQFSASDAVKQEQMLSFLRRVCPYLHVSFEKQPQHV